MTTATILKQAATKGADIAAVADLAIQDPACVAELVHALTTEEGTARYAYEKVLRSISDHRPELLYPYFDVFAGLLDCDNSFLKWGAIMTIAFPHMLSR